MRHPAFLDTPPPGWVLVALVIVSAVLMVLVLTQRA